MVYTLFPDSLNMSTVEECVARLEKGDVAIIPTDSVYAIAGDFQHPKALEKLAKIKAESVKWGEFSYLFTGISQVSEYTQCLDFPTFKLVRKCLPGP